MRDNCNDAPRKQMKNNLLFNDDVPEWAADLLHQWGIHATENDIHLIPSSRNTLFLTFRTSILQTECASHQQPEMSYSTISNRTNTYL
jgi:hypothetical protein